MKFYNYYLIFIYIIESMEFPNNIIKNIIRICIIIIIILSCVLLIIGNQMAIDFKKLENVKTRGYMVFIIMMILGILGIIFLIYLIYLMISKNKDNKNYYIILIFLVIYFIINVLLIVYSSKLIKNISYNNYHNDYFYKYNDDYDYNQLANILHLLFTLNVIVLFIIIYLFRKNLIPKIQLTKEQEKFFDKKAKIPLTKEQEQEKFPDKKAKIPLTKEQEEKQRIKDLIQYKQDYTKELKNNSDANCIKKFENYEVPVDICIDKKIYKKEALKMHPDKNNECNEFASAAIKYVNSVHERCM